MHTQVITITATGVAMEHCDTLCTECAAICNRIAGVQATEWQVNRATGIIAGIMRWSEYEAIAMGTETLRLQVAHLTGAQVVLSSRTLPCMAAGPHAPDSPATHPQPGCVQYPPDYDHRG